MFRFSSLNFSAPNLSKGLVLGLVLSSLGALTACQSSTRSSAVNAPAVAARSAGTLEFRANGEDLVRQGWVSKDGWQLAFDHVYVSLTEVTAGQDGHRIDLSQAHTVDLAQGDTAADPILFATREVPAHHYKSLSWTLAPASVGPAQGQAIKLVGQAQRDGRTVDFVLNWDRAYSYRCGDFIGDQRKGIVKPGQTADVEATFHLDHWFGDRDLPTDDPLNQDAVGFDAFAALAQTGEDGVETVELDRAELAQQLAPEDWKTMESVFYGLGHVGEGHCDTQQLAQ